MVIEKARIESIQKLSNYYYLIEVFSPLIAKEIKPGQFCNIKVTDTNYPLLRRPFSICDVDANKLIFVFDVHGEGTKILSSKKKGDELDILGPLGNGFTIEGKYDLAILIGGGIGTAPFPYLTKKISSDVDIISFIGGRTKEHLIKYQMKNIHLATDDGSEGFHGTIIDLFKMELKNFINKKIRIFACGPTPMLKALQQISLEQNLDCQLSVECAMACGFGICQGCPIEKSNGDGYYLVCKDGPIFDADKILF
ncbi:dihydroorotate dehydrogenase electron transfer subunit [Rosettibacter firmus]|uniref:dihydroorotate dehydrogenase electron transfer subunit n=1 Tax=Rosettibacter firmus TaxID=3111522 RepID=UPI00336C118C